MPGPWAGTCLSHVDGREASMEGAVGEGCREECTWEGEQGQTARDLVGDHKELIS